MSEQTDQDRAALLREAKLHVEMFGPHSDERGYMAGLIEKLLAEVDRLAGELVAGEAERNDIVESFSGLESDMRTRISLVEGERDRARRATIVEVEELFYAVHREYRREPAQVVAEFAQRIRALAAGGEGGRE